MDGSIYIPEQRKIIPIKAVKSISVDFYQEDGKLSKTIIVWIQFLQGADEKIQWDINPKYCSSAISNYELREAINENIKDFYINISGKVLINSSKIVSVSAEYKRYNTYWELEKDGLTEIAELARDVHYFETEDEEAENFTLQNIRITIQTVTGTPFIYDSLAMLGQELGDRYGLASVNLNPVYLRLKEEYINQDLNNYITELFEKRKNITSRIWSDIKTDVLEELYAYTYGWYMILKSDAKDKNNEQWNHEPHTLYVIDRKESKIIKITDLVREHFNLGYPDDRYRSDTAAYQLRNFLYINTRRTVYTDNIKDMYPHIPIITISYKSNFMELMKLREEQK